MKSILFSIVLIFASSKSFAQDPDRNLMFFFNAGPQITIHTKVDFQIIENGQVFSGSSDDAGTIATGFLLEAGYFIIKKKLSLGMGIAIENSLTYRAKYWPLYIDAKYFLTPGRNSLYFFTNAGKMLRNNGNKMDGHLLTIGAGKKLFFTNKLATNLSIGYSLRVAEYSNPHVLYLFGPNPDAYSLKAQGIEFKACLFF